MKLTLIRYRNVDEILVDDFEDIEDDESFLYPYKRYQDVEIQTKLERSDIDIVYSLEDLAWQILKKVKESKKK